MAHMWFQHGIALKIIIFIIIKVIEIYAFRCRHFYLLLVFSGSPENSVDPFGVVKWIHHDSKKFAYCVFAFNFCQSNEKPSRQT